MKKLVVFLLLLILVAGTGIVLFMYNSNPSSSQMKNIDSISTEDFIAQIESEINSGEILNIDCLELLSNMYPDETTYASAMVDTYASGDESKRLAFLKKRFFETNNSIYLDEISKSIEFEISNIEDKRVESLKKLQVNTLMKIIRVTGGFFTI